MSHLYPLAATVEDAIAPNDRVARTRYEADALTAGEDIAGLETEWVTPKKSELDTFSEAAARGLSAGFIQRYEDASGAPVFAVTFWRIAPNKARKPTVSKPKPQPPSSEDHTDELYFRAGRTKKKKARRKPKVDPRQLDLFTGPDQQGYERRDPDNPGVILTDEEGDGTAFGLAPKTIDPPEDE